MNVKKIYLYILILFLIVQKGVIFGSNLELTDLSDDFINPSKYVLWLNDLERKLTISDILKSEYQKELKENTSNKLNFGFSKSGIWLKLTIKNKTEIEDFILEINNPDLNHVCFYEIEDDQIKDSIITGELTNFSSRELNNRNYIFDLRIEKNKNKTYYLYLYNSGDAINVPVAIYTDEKFYQNESPILLLLGLFFGFGFFIVLFNFYLFYSLKDIIHLYYALYVFFTFLFIFSTDGLSFQYFWPDSPKWSNQSSYLFAMLGIVFLINFVQIFLANSKFISKQKRVFSLLKLSTVILFICSFFESLLSFSVLGLLSVFSLSIVLFVILSYSSLNKDFIPNHYFLGAFGFMLLGAVIYAFRDLGYLPYNFVTKNSVRIGILMESIILTIAIIERFHYNQENAQKAIQKSHSKIELQNKELEIINAELEKLSIVASETDNSVAIYDKSGRIEWCNEGFEQFYETDISTLIKQKTELIEEIIPFNNVKELFKKCLEDKEAVIFEAKLKFKGKKDKWLHTTLSPYVKGNKVIAVDTDITSLKDYEADLKLAKEKAEESDKIKTIFLSNMSHEVRTPLNGILGFSELLNSDGLSPEDRTRFVEIIKSNGEQLIRIIDDILDMSLIETNQLKIWNSKFSLTQLCNELVEFFEFYKTTINKSEVKLIKEYNIDIESDLIYSDNSRLKQVLMNLLKNGFKFTDEGYVKMSCSTKEDNILFCVEDTGIGIEPSKIGEIFKRFRQADERTTRKYGGNGLGLSISKGIIEKMGGYIWIDPEYTLGFKICFVIPLGQIRKNLDNNEIDGAEERRRAKIKDKRILIVEDNDASYQYLGELLQPFTTLIFRAANGVEAVQKIKDNHFDIVLMDINLPGLDGIEATKQIRRFNIDIPIIAQTAYAMSTEESEILESGCNDVISKPINTNKLFEKIEMYL